MGVVMPRVYEKNYFTYKGVHYGYGTVVKFKPEVYKGLAGATKLKGVFEFYEGLTNGYLKFKSTDKEVSKAGMMGDWNPNDVIECIIKPVYVELQPVWKKALENYSKATPEHKHLAFPGTAIYIIVMLVGTLFNDRWLIYIAATIIYFNYWVNQYRDY